MRVDYVTKFISREDVRENPKTLFLFGDNYERRGYGGQAKEMRGEPNAYGIATKNRPDNKEGAWFSDDFYEVHKRLAELEFAELRERIVLGDYNFVVVPDRMGMGRADLQNKAPKFLDFMAKKISELAEL